MKGKLTFYCRMLHVSRQAFYKYLQRNDTYGRSRMRDALLQKKPKDVDIPSERTVYQIMEEISISHHPKRKPNGIMMAFHPWSRDNNTIHLYREQLRIVNP